MRSALQVSENIIIDLQKKPNTVKEKAGSDTREMVMLLREILVEIRRLNAHLELGEQELVTARANTANEPTKTHKDFLKAEENSDDEDSEELEYFE